MIRRTGVSWRARIVELGSCFRITCCSPTSPCSTTSPLAFVPVATQRRLPEALQWSGWGEMASTSLANAAHTSCLADRRSGLRSSERSRPNPRYCYWMSRSVPSTSKRRPMCEHGCLDISPTSRGS